MYSLWTYQCLSLSLLTVKSVNLAVARDLDAWLSITEIVCIYNSAYFTLIAEVLFEQLLIHTAVQWIGHG